MHAIGVLVLLYVWACSPLYSAGSKTRRRSETKHESSIPLTIRFEPPILLEMLTRFNDADEGNQLKGYQRQARNIGRLIGEGCACKSQLESSFSFDFYTIKGGYSTYLERATLKPILLLFSRFQFQRSLFSGQDRRNKKPTSHSGAGNSIAFKTVRIRTDRTVTEGAHFFSFAFLSFHYKVPSFCYPALMR